MAPYPRKAAYVAMLAVLGLIGLWADLITIDGSGGLACNSRAPFDETEPNDRDGAARGEAGAVEGLPAAGAPGRSAGVSPRASSAVRQPAISSAAPLSGARVSAAAIPAAPVSASTVRGSSGWRSSGWRSSRWRSSGTGQHGVTEAEFRGRELFFSPRQRAMLLREPHFVRSDVLRHYPATEAR